MHLFNEDDDKTVTKFIEKYISCLLPNVGQYPELHAVVKGVQNNAGRKKKLHADLMYHGLCQQKHTACENDQWNKKFAHWIRRIIKIF